MPTQTKPHRTPREFTVPGLSAPLSFMKMNGLGNDFVILDARRPSDAAALPALVARPAFFRALADRTAGPGCDQIVVLENSEEADVFMRIMNADGSESGACGNATRCIAALEGARFGKRSLLIETIAGLLACRIEGDAITVNMGQPRLDWADVPLSAPHATLELPLELFPLAETPTLGGPTAVNVGNPHCVFFVKDVAAVDVAGLGPALETHPLFPERVNVEFVEIVSRERLRMRVWERGAGVTRACGSGAVASLVAASRRGFSGRRAEVAMDGGALLVEWRDDGVWMTGPASFEYEGRLVAATFV